MNSWLIEIRWALMDGRSAGCHVEFSGIACSFEWALLSLIVQQNIRDHGIKIKYEY